MDPDLLVRERCFAPRQVPVRPQYRVEPHSVEPSLILPSLDSTAPGPCPFRPLTPCTVPRFGPRNSPARWRSAQDNLARNRRKARTLTWGGTCIRVLYHGKPSPRLDPALRQRTPGDPNWCKIWRRFRYTPLSHQQHFSPRVVIPRSSTPGAIRLSLPARMVSRGRL